jgi:23S rRNA pseudouridine2605 synthase
VKERVQKLMAQADIGSRRACEEIIRQGRVRVNGVVIELGTKADLETDVVEVDGERISSRTQQKVYIAFHKPRNVLSTTAPHKGDDRQTVRDLIPVEGHLFTIGRLDAESEGLIILTNDGDLTNRLTHPRYGHTKTYKVEIYGLPTAEAIKKWETGVMLEEGMTAPCSVQITHRGKEQVFLRVVMTEGKKRQIRRVATELGYPVRRLIRTHIGQLALGTLRVGEWRKLSASEIKAMLAQDENYLHIRRQQKEKPRPTQSRRKPAGEQRQGSLKRSPKRTQKGRNNQQSNRRNDRSNKRHKS